MASSPSTTLHKIPPTYPVLPLSSASGYFSSYMALRLGKTPDIKDKRKNLASPMNPEANLPPPAPKPLMVAKINLI
jgi:hypothetical protein